MVALVTGNKRHPQSERSLDLYETPPEAVTALLKVEPIPFSIWEPACGPGAIVRTLRATGRTVVATDLVDYGCPDSRGEVNFLEQAEMPSGAAAILTNPPFYAAPMFVRHARKLSPLVIMLTRLAFLESVGRTDLLDSGDLARIYLFANRLPMMHRHQWQGPKASSAMAFAWLVWSRDHIGPTQFRRIRWEAED